MRGSVRLLSLSVISVVLVVFFIGCQQTKDDPEPAETSAHSIERLEAMVAHLPADKTQAVVFVKNFETAASRADSVVEDVGKLTDDPNMPEQIREDILTSGTLGFYLFDTEQWKRSGLELNGPMVIGLVEGRPVMIADVSDSDAVNAFMAEFADNEVEKLEDDGRAYFATRKALWAFSDNRVFIAPRAAARQPSDAHVETVLKMANGAGSSGLSGTDSFAQFSSNVLEDALVGVYMPPNEELARKLFSQTRLTSRRGPLDPKLEDDFVASFRGVGLGANFDEETVRVNGWFGLDEEASAELERLLTPEGSPNWSGLLGHQNVGMVHLQADPTRSWAWFRSLLKPRYRQMLDAGLASSSQATGADFEVERDFISKLSGHFAAGLYPIAADRDRRDPFNINGRLAGVVVVEFVDKQAPARLLEVMEQAVATRGAEAAVTAVETGPEGDSAVRAFEVSGVGPKFYVAGRLMAVSTRALAEDKVAALLDEADPNAQRTELASRVVAPESTWGMHINAAKLTELIGIQSRFGADASLLEEVAVVARPTSSGLVVRAEASPSTFMAYMPFAFDRYIKRSKASEAVGVLRKMSDGARAYFQGEQQYVGCTANQTHWHCAKKDGLDQKPGFQVSFRDKVFPGGKNQRLVTSTQIPSGGAKVPTQPEAAQHLEATLKQLGLNFFDPLYFQYTYETNGKSGKDAEATLRAVHDFDPSTPEMHTVEVHLRLDENNNIVVTPAVTLDEFE